MKTVTQMCLKQKKTLLFSPEINWSGILAFEVSLVEGEEEGEGGRLKL